MRSTRHKFKMLRGISRSTSSNGGEGIDTSVTCGSLPYRKQDHYQQSANFQRHSSADSVTNESNSQSQPHNNHNNYSNGSQSEPNKSIQPPHRSHSDGQVNGSGAKHWSTHHQRLRPYNQHPTPFIVPSSAPLSTLITANSTSENNNNLTDHIQSLTWSEIHSSTTSTMDCELNSDIRAKAFAICKDYLHGVWKQIDARDLVVKRIR